MPSRRRVLGGIAGASLGGLAGCLGEGPTYSPGSDADADWPMPRLDSTNTAYDPDAAAPRDGVTERWTHEGTMASAPPVVADGRVFLPTIDGLYAFDSESGERLWRYGPDENPWSSPATVYDGTVFVAFGNDDAVHAVDAETGEQIWWRADAATTEAGPHLLAGQLVDDPVLYTGNRNGLLFRHDPETGDITWQTDLFGEIRAFGYRAGQLFVGTGSGEVYAFAESGEGRDRPGEMWRRKVGGAVGSILPDEEGVLVTTFGGPLRCLQSGAHAGTTRWTVPASMANVAPVGADGWFVTAGYDSLASVREFDRKVGWKIGGRYDATPPVAAGDTLYVSDGEAVHAFALDGGTGIGEFRVGAKRWTHRTPGIATEGLAVADGALFVACSTGESDDTGLYCLEPA